MEFLEGTLEGKVTSAKWSKWHDDDSGQDVPLLNVMVQSGEHVLKPTLFFDTSLITGGNDAGKSKIQISLEVLKSMGLKVDPIHPEQLDPTGFVTELIGKNASVYCDVTDSEKPKQRYFLNRVGRPELKPEELQSIWKQITGQEPKQGEPVDAEFEKAAEGDDDLPF